MPRTPEQIKKKRERYLEHHPTAVFCMECGRPITDSFKSERQDGYCSSCYNKNHGVVWQALDNSGRLWKKIDRDAKTEEIVIEESYAELEEETEIEVTVLELW